MRVRTRCTSTVPFLLSLLVLSGCGAANVLQQEVARLQSVHPRKTQATVGGYKLVEYNGKPLPAPVMVAQLPQNVCGGGHLAAAEAVAGSIDLEADGTATLSGTSVVTCTDATGKARSQEIGVDSEGRYETRGGRLRIDLGGGRSMALTYDSVAGTLSQDGPQGRAVWKRGPSIARVEDAPRVDTVGLASRIARAFPGYRLATGEEIRSQLNEGRHGPAEQIYPPRGSGTVGWMWTGDLDGDARPDQATILSPAAGTPASRIGVLLGNGRSILLGDQDDIISDPVSTTEPGRRVLSCAEGINDVDNLMLRTHAVVVGDYIWYWRDGEFRSFYTGC
jgi:hypothetical protein